VTAVHLIERIKLFASMLLAIRDFSGILEVVRREQWFGIELLVA
jgi:hypothetical protein